MRVKKLKLGIRDSRVLTHIWRFKIATTRSIYLKYFKDSRPQNAYNRLRELKNAGYIANKRDIKGNNSVWELTQLGFRAVKINSGFPLLRENGFKSECPIHDLLCSAAHLGEFLIKTPSSINLVTEQELRRVDEEFLPDWVFPRNDHRPDGYWYIKNRNRTRLVALEVERTQKKYQSYEEVAEYYSDCDLLDRVIWFVRTEKIAKAMNLILTQKNLGRKEIHNFALIEDLLEKGWDLKFILGPEEGVCYRNFFDELDGSLTVSRPLHDTVMAILDTRISLHNNRENGHIPLRWKS